MKSELHQFLVRAIQELSEKEQQVLSLYYYEELTMKKPEPCSASVNRASRRFTPRPAPPPYPSSVQLAGKQISPHVAEQAIRSTMEDAWKKY